MEIDRESGVPPWRQIAADLRQQIQSGKLAPGKRLPSEEKLRKRYGVARSTVRKALGDLQEAGLVDSEPAYAWHVVSRENGRRDNP